MAGDFNSELFPGSVLAATLELGDENASDLEMRRECASAERVAAASEASVAAWAESRAEARAFMVAQRCESLRKLEGGATRAAWDHAPPPGEQAADEARRMATWRLDHALSGVQRHSYRFHSDLDGVLKSHRTRANTTFELSRSLHSSLGNSSTTHSQNPTESQIEYSGVGSQVLYSGVSLRCAQRWATLDELGDGKGFSVQRDTVWTLSC